MKTRNRIQTIGPALWLTATCFFLISGFPPLGAAANAQDIAVIANLDVPDDDLSLAEIRKLLLGDRQFWSSGLRVTLLIRAPVARERDTVLKKIYQMTDAQYRQYWIAKIFRAEAVAEPKIVYSSEMATEVVRAIPGCITFVSADQIQEGVKVLRIDGKAPGEEGYPLR